MKKMIKLAMAVALTAFAAACSSQEDIPATNENEVNGSTGPTEFSIEGIINGYEETADSRAEAQTVVRIHWQGNETVYVYDGTSCIGSLIAQPDENNKAIAKLSGTLTDAPSGTKPLTLVYSPLFTDEPAVTDGKLSLDLSEQSTEKVPFLIYGVISNLNKDVDNKVVNFQLATSVYKCNAVKLIKEGSIFKTTIDNINTKCVLTLSNDANPTVGGDEVGTITRSTGFTSADERAVFTFALPVTSTTGTRTLRVLKNNGKEQSANFTQNPIAAAKSFNAVFAFGEASYGNVDYVEIGGKRWATKNLGAVTVAGSYETCAGDFYQWGSINTLYSAKTLTQDNVQYKWTFTWKTGKENGFHMNNREYTGWPLDDYLPDANDAVSQNMKNGWRTPTVADFKKLLEACLEGNDLSPDFVFEGVPLLSSSNPAGGVYYLQSNQIALPEYGGVVGILFVDKTDTSKRLFFPFATKPISGHLNTGDKNVGYAGYADAGYMTKDFVGEGYDGVHKSFSLQTLKVQFSNLTLAFGFPIRPVHDIN